MRGRLHSTRRLLASYYHTVKHLTPHQVLHRLKFMILRQVERQFGRHILAFYRWRSGRLPRVSRTLLGEASVHGIGLLPQAWDTGERLERAKGVLVDQYTFLHETQVLAGKALWRCEAASQLWRYNIHYFDYVVDLAVAFHLTKDRTYFDKFSALVSDWLEHNPPGSPDAWHPYPLSLRVVNWLYGRAFFADLLAEGATFRKQLDSAVALQLDYLSHRLEHDVRGNHLLKNAKALVIGGLSFEGSWSRQWLKAGLDLMEREAMEQVLPDGGHFERSLMYHLIVLQDYAETCILLRDAGEPVPPSLVDTVQSMADFCRGMLHPDGDIPLFGDAKLLDRREVESVLALAAAAVTGSYGGAAPGAINLLLSGVPAGATETSGRVGLAAYPETGYYVFRNDQDYLAVDCGEPCPTYLPAHAHADMLSYEVSLGGRRFIVDAGTYEYQTGVWRQHFRSTAAHNTLVVNGLEQSRAWGSFRMAERAEVLGGRFVHGGDGVEAFMGAYRAPYRGRKAFVHHRTILWLDRSYWVVLDVVEGPELQEGVNRVLLSPDCTVHMEGSTVKAERDGMALRIVPLEGTQFDIEVGWYSPYFGVKHQTQRLTLPAKRDSGRLVSAYAILPIRCAVSDLTLRLQGSQILIQEPSRTWEWSVQPVS